MNGEFLDNNRDSEWLENMLSDIWYKYFLDVEQKNTVIIQFGRKAKRRLGSISVHRKDRRITVITINPLYKDARVPEFVAIATVVHELTHYAHGFNSPLEQKHRHPHSGGVIRKEFAERGLEKLYVKQQKWLKENWQTIINEYFVPKQKSTRTKYVGTVAFPRWFR